MEIKNDDLNEVIAFLSTFTMPRTVARANSKFVGHLKERLQELIDNEKELVESFGGTVDDGGHISGLDNEKLDEFQAERKQLLSETATIEPDYKEQFSILKSFFDGWDGEVSPSSYKGMNALYDALDTIGDVDAGEK